MPSVTLPPFGITATGASLNQSAQLAPGQIIDAVVLSLIKDTTFRLQLPTGTLDIQTDVPLIPGTRVELAVEGTASQPRLVVTPLPDGAMPARLAAMAKTSTQILATPIAPRTDNVGQAAATIVRDAATRQGGVANLYADLAAGLARANITVPPPVIAAAKQLFALRLDTTAPTGVSADDIKAALVRSGLVGTPLGSDLSLSTPPLDVRAVLLSLRQALKNWENIEKAATPPAENAPSVGPLAAKAMPRTAGPMLPYPNGPTVPQAQTGASLPPNAAPGELALHLLDKTDAAIAREMLLKIASLPETADPGARPGARPGAKPGEAAASRMTFDIPLATATGTAVAQIRIERDAAQRNNDNEVIAPVWRANFSVDVEPIGAVHVRIALQGGKTVVTLNADRAASAQGLAAGLPLLEAGLRNAALDPGHLSCQQGQPAAASADRGLYVDHAT
jgi:hypothetical protein